MEAERVDVTRTPENRLLRRAGKSNRLKQPWSPFPAFWQGRHRLTGFSMLLNVLTKEKIAISSRK